MHTTVTQMIKAAPAMTTMTPSAATMQMQHNFRNAYDVQSVFRNIISLHEFASTTSRYNCYDYQEPGNSELSQKDRATLHVER